MGDYSKALKCAASFRELIGIDENHPLNIMNLILALRYMGIEIFRYDELASANNGSIEELIDIWGPDGAAVMINNRKFIVLNTGPESLIGRMVWTLLHETGHFILGHLKESDCVCLRSEKYDRFEKEADVFAANVLLPEKAVYRYIRRHCNDGLIIDVNQMAAMRDYFTVSWSALANRLDFLRIQPSDLTDFLFETYEERKEIARNEGTHINSPEMQKLTFLMWQGQPNILEGVDNNEQKKKRSKRRLYPVA